ncbi:hypothetical protein [Microbacterium sp. zg-YB36]|uniref:hypothetical protein n=1 Tax=Microbacterium sp. zg-YB36 TaxID=2969407 RepID=UPI00214B2503|nr:hypothetical protein [Microbacterium sp. zg-YB36]MDL5352135.1 hypothetical protein [Microbacterium sp. zg-YB36]
MLPSVPASARQFFGDLQFFGPPRVMASDVLSFSEVAAQDGTGCRAPPARNPAVPSLSGIR